MSAKKLTFEEAREKLKERFPYLELLTYEKNNKPCKVLDLEYNEEFTYFSYIDLKRAGGCCPSRRKKTSKDRYEKTKNTLKEKYGVEFLSQIQGVKDKRKQTILDRFGVEHSFQSKEVKEKIKQTVLDRYGVENPAQSKEVQEKIKQTNLEKYGVESAFQSKEIKEKIKQTNLEKYGVKNPFQSKEVKEKINQTNLEKYGAENPFQSKEIREKIKSTMLQRYGVEQPNPTKSFNGKTTKELMDETGLSRSHVLNLMREGIDPATFEKHETIIEKKIKELLTTLNVNFIQESAQFKQFIPDFLLEDHKIIIEADGLYWHSESVLTNRTHGKNHSMQRRRFYENLGYRVITFREDQILNQFNIVESIIKNALRLTSIKIGARELEIQEINQETTRRFLDENHLMGRGAGRAFGLVDKEGNIQSLIQVKCKSRERNEFEISRFCNKLNTTVSGAFSRLLKNVVGVFTPSLIITFTDLNYGTGNYLVNFGFKQEAEYPSFKWTDYRNLWNRMEFRGKSGEDLGLDRIWDSGQRKWIRYY